MGIFRNSCEWATSKFRNLVNSQCDDRSAVSKSIMNALEKMFEGMDVTWCMHHEANSVIGVNFLSRACITSRVQFSPFHKHTYEYITVAIVDSRCLSNRRNQLINMFLEIFSYQIKFTRECCVRCEWEAETADHSPFTNEKEEKWQISTEKYSHSQTRVVVKLEI